MKRFSFIGSILLLATVVTFLFIGCQKEAAVTDETEQTSTSSEGAVTKGTDGGSSAINGLISEENGRLMAAEYLKTYPKANTISVRYATKDLIAFLKLLNNKYKSDSVYVTFGVYNKKTAHYPAEIGRTTVFFVGNKVGASGGPVRTNDDKDDEFSSKYLNGGGLEP